VGRRSAEPGRLASEQPRRASRQAVCVYASGILSKPLRPDATQARASLQLVCSINYFAPGQPTTALSRRGQRGRWRGGGGNAEVDHTRIGRIGIGIHLDAAFAAEGRAVGMGPALDRIGAAAART